MEEDPKKAGQWWEGKPDLEGRTKKEVKQWLQHFKQENELDFEVDDVACPGKLLAAMAKEDLEKCGGGVAGVHMFISSMRKKNSRKKVTPSVSLQMTFSPNLV